MVNVCPNCHAVSYGKNGWRIINKYNGAKFCAVCNHGIKCYKDVDDVWIEEQKRLHEEWRKSA